MFYINFAIGFFYVIVPQLPNMNDVKMCFQYDVK